MFGKNKEKAPAKMSSKAESTPKVSLNAKPKKSASIGRRTITLIICVVAVAVCMFLASTIMSKQASYVTVVGILEDNSPGTLMTESRITPITLVYEDYQNLGMQTWVDEQGNKHSEQVFVEWANRKSVLDQYLVYYETGGTILTTRKVTPDLLIRSAWVKDVEQGMELYTMKFSVTDVYYPVFFPGSHVRIRMTYDVPVEDATLVRTQVRAKENQLELGNYVANGQSIILENIYKSSGTVSDFSTVNSKTVPISEIIFNDIVIVDMLNNANESVFDLYVELLGMPVSQRIEYLKSAIEGTGANAFKQKVTPTQVVFVVTREEATCLAEFEKLGAALKYTILPQSEVDYDLMTQFTKIGSQIQSLLENASTTSFN